MHTRSAQHHADCHPFDVREWRRDVAQPATPRLLRADGSDRGFTIGLYLEHLEEASFLYDQRVAFLDDRELRWPELEPFEDRLEAHIDALVLGDELALAVCRQRVRDGDRGELHAALSVVCRQRRLDLLYAILESVDPSHSERVGAAIDALTRELPSEWAAIIDDLARANDVGLRVIAAPVVGRRAIGRQDRLAWIPSLRDQPSERLVATALSGRIDAVEPLVAALRSDVTAPTAALGLRLLTGAGLFERITGPADFDDDELVEAENGFDASGVSAGSARSAAAQSTITRLSRDPSVWSAWWGSNASRFDPQRRYREGLPYCAVAAVATLRDVWVPRDVRELVYDELVIELGAQVAFRTDMFVSEQVRALAALHAWAVALGHGQRSGT